LYAAGSKIKMKHEFFFFILQVSNGRIFIQFDANVGAYLLRLRFSFHKLEIPADNASLGAQDHANEGSLAIQIQVQAEAEEIKQEKVLPNEDRSGSNNATAPADESEVINLIQDTKDEQEPYVTKGVQELIPQFFHQAWENYCKFFQHPVECSANEYTYCIPGTQLHLHSYQLFCVYWCL
jgi:hypothetical protein